MLATLLSFMFFALSFHAQPFNTTRLNVIKICSEAQIFGILLACVVLQTHQQGYQLAIDAEPITIEDYGTAQVWLALAILPVTIYLLGVSVRDLHADKKATKKQQKKQKQIEKQNKSREANEKEIKEKQRSKKAKRKHTVQRDVGSKTVNPLFTEE